MYPISVGMERFNGIPMEIFRLGEIVRFAQKITYVHIASNFYLFII